MDADILIHKLDQPLDSIAQGRHVTFARAVGGRDFNSGFMVFDRSEQALAYLGQVQGKIDAVPDKSTVYASGGDQRYFIDAWREAGDPAAIPLSDCVSFNSHPALYDAQSLMVHYMGYGSELRALLMRHDSRLIAGS